MNTASADPIAKAVFYEGYMLYPYRPSAVNNQQRFNFGVVYPQSFSDAQRRNDPWIMQTECVVQRRSDPKLEVQVRFPQLVERSVQATIEPGLVQTCADLEFRHVESLAVEAQTYYSWQEAVERELDIPATDLDTLVHHSMVRPFHLPSSTSEEDLSNARGQLMGRIVRNQHPIDGFVKVRADQVEDQLFKVRVKVRNITWIHDASQVNREFALMRSLVSTHIILGVDGGEIVSLLDPPESLQSIAAAYHNQGAFPVLVGEEGQHDTVLASPIILYSIHVERHSPDGVRGRIDFVQSHGAEIRNPNRRRRLDAGRSSRHRTISATTKYVGAVSS